MLLKASYTKFIASFSLLFFGLIGVFSFCFAHETLAHTEHLANDHTVVTSELHDSHCGAEIISTRASSYSDSTAQLFHKYFPAVAILPQELLNLHSLTAQTMTAFPRGRPPSRQQAHLQVFRC